MTTNGSEEASGSKSIARFIEVYNDTVNFPVISDVATAVKRSEKRVINLAAILRNQGSLTLHRRKAEESGAKAIPTPGDHASFRSRDLSAAVYKMITGSMYPVVNPEAMTVESHVATRYDPLTGMQTETGATPRTWLSDTLRASDEPFGVNKRFIFTGAQNDTPISEPFWENLQAYAAEIGAKIVIGPWTYETTWWSENNPSSRKYDPAIADYLCFGQMNIGEKFVFCGEMNTLPTATNPISDLTTYSRGRWAVYPHAKVQLISVPASDPHQQAFQIMTTGAVTLPKVIPRKAGVKSIFHHQLGATLVEFDADGDLFCRQLLAEKDGSFQDLDVMVAGGVVSHGNRVEAITAADIHVAKLNPRNSLATFGYEPFKGARRSDSLLDALQPKWLLLHDIHDHESRNHHHKDDVSHDFEMAHRGRDNVLGEVRLAVNFVTGIKRPDMNILVVDSNHDLALERYIREGRYRLDGKNFLFGLKLDTAYHEHRMKIADALDAGTPAPSFSLLEWAMRSLDGAGMASVDWVYDGCSKIINGIQVGYHGFRGTNGAKGTVTGYARLGHKVSIGDKHSPSILEGVYGAGVMQLEHGYNKGPSGWAVAHIVQYPNGKRAIITLQNGKWRGSS